MNVNCLSLKGGIRRKEMKYIALLYGVEDNKEPTPEEMQPWFDFNEKYKEYIVGGEALLPTNTASSLSEATGKLVVSDGPFAETKEALGGFYVLECKDMQQALDVAKEIPSAKYGTIEVRPVMVIPGED